MLHARAERLHQKPRRQRLRRLRCVEDQAQCAVFRLKNLALYEAARIEHVLFGKLREIEQRLVEQQPSQHLLVVHRLGDVVDRGQPRVVPRACSAELREIDIPNLRKLALGIGEVHEAPAETPHGGNFQFARAERLPEGLVEQALRAIERRHGVIHA